MANHQRSQSDTDSKQKKSVFIIGMVRVGDQFCIIIRKYRFSFIEANSVFFSINSRLS